MVGVVGRIDMIFLEVEKGVSEGHQGRKEAVEYGTMALVPSATTS